MHDELTEAQRLVVAVKKACGYTDRQLGAALGSSGRSLVWSARQVKRWRDGDREMPLAVVFMLRDMLAECSARQHQAA